MRFTYRAAGPIAAAVVLTLVCACSRTQQDWRVAQQANTAESYNVFVARHSDSELASVARQRIAQLIEEAAWQQATRANTATAYRDYLTKYPNGSWSQDARIRMESRSLAAQPPQGAEVAPGAAITCSRGNLLLQASPLQLAQVYVRLASRRGLAYRLAYPRGRPPAQRAPHDHCIGRGRQRVHYHHRQRTAVRRIAFHDPASRAQLIGSKIALASRLGRAAGKQLTAEMIADSPVWHQVQIFLSTQPSRRSAVIGRRRSARPEAAETAAARLPQSSAASAARSSRGCGKVSACNGQLLIRRRGLNAHKVVSSGRSVDRYSGFRAACAIGSDS